MSSRPLPYGGLIEARGSLDRRFRMALSRLTNGPEYTEEFILSDVTGDYWRVFTEYAGDISGRYVGGVALGRTYARDAGTRVDRVARGIAAAQREDGHFNLELAPDAVHYPLIYGHGRLLQGMVEYHSVAPSSEILHSIRRLADYFCDTAEVWRAPEVVANHEFIYYTQSLEGVVGAWTLTGDPRHLELARSMADLLWPEPKHHSHSYLSSLLGILALHEATGEERYLRRVVEARDAIASMVTVDGGVTEMLPDKWVTEFCSVADWFMLNVRLGRVTGNGRYMDAAEKILLNAIYFNQFASGGFGTLNVDKANGYPGRVEVGSSEAYWCCCFHGVRSLYDALTHAYTVGSGAVRVNLFVDSTVHVAEHGATLRQETVYPAEGRSRLWVSAAGAPRFALEIRIPGWAAGAQVRVNGAPETLEAADGYCRLERTWGVSDVVDIAFDVELRLEEGTRAVPTDALAPGADLAGVSLWWGPILLAIDEMYNAAGPSDEKVRWTAPDHLLLPVKSGTPVLPRREAPLPAVPEWPLVFDVQALRNDAATPLVLTPLARTPENQPTCAPSTRTRYRARIDDAGPAR